MQFCSWVKCVSQPVRFEDRQVDAVQPDPHQLVIVLDHPCVRLAELEQILGLEQHGDLSTGDADDLVQVFVLYIGLPAPPERFQVFLADQPVVVPLPLVELHDLDMPLGDMEVHAVAAEPQGTRRLGHGVVAVRYVQLHMLYLRI